MLIIMKVHRHHVYNDNDFRHLVQTYLDNNYRIIAHENNMFCLERPIYGNLLIHMVLFILTFWFSFGLLNIIYFFINRYFNQERIIITLNLDESGFNYLSYSADYDVMFNDLSEIINYLNAPVSASDDDESIVWDSSTSILDYLEHK